MAQAAQGKKQQRRVSLIGQLGLDCDFVAFSDKNNHVTYEIKLTCQANDMTWNVKKRYSDFHNIDKALRSDRNFRGIKLPSLPPKTYSFTDASKRELTEKRMAQLQEYLRGIIGRNAFLTSEEVIQFLEMPNAVRQLAQVLTSRQNAPLKQGWMWKKGAINKKWKKRWFVLQPNYILKYYKADDSHDPQGSIDITTIGHINTKDSSADKKHSFALKTRERIWLLAAEDEQSRREWTRLFMRLKDTKAPTRHHFSPMDQSQGGASSANGAAAPGTPASAAYGGTETSNQRLSLNLGPHFRPITQIAWSPVIPGILATGSEDESVKIWNTHLLDHTLLPSEPFEFGYMPPLTPHNTMRDDGDEKQHIAAMGSGEIKALNEELGAAQESIRSVGSLGSVGGIGGISGLSAISADQAQSPQKKEKKWHTTYPIHAVEFRPIAEYRTSGQVTSLEWSPDGLMLVVSLKKEFKREELEQQAQQAQQQEPQQGQGQQGQAQQAKFGYFIQCFDLSPHLSGYTEDELDDDDDNGDQEDNEQQRTKIFTLQDHPSQLSFSGDGNNIYMSMDIDPNSEENEKRRPAFLVYLDLTQNQLHRCKTVDRIIDHQTEFIVALAMNHSCSVMVVATCTHQGSGRLIAWDVEKNETRLVERQGKRATHIIWTEDDSWLIVGRMDGKIELWSVYNTDNKKLAGIYEKMIENFNKTQTNNQAKASNDANDNKTDSSNNNNNDDNNNNSSGSNDPKSSEDVANGNSKQSDDAVDEDDNLHDKSVDIEKAPSVAIFEQKYVESAHSGPVFSMTTSNGILITSAKPNDLEYESFFVDNCVWDIRATMNNGSEAKMIARLHNINDTEKDITRLLALSPVTPRHVREGGGPGTLLAASGMSHVYCHNMMDVILDALTRPADAMNGV